MRQETITDHQTPRLEIKYSVNNIRTKKSTKNSNPKPQKATRKAALAWSWKLRNFSAASEEQRAMRGWPPISRHRSFRTELVQSNCLRRFRTSEEQEPPASKPCFLALTRKRTRTGVFLWFSIRPPSVGSYSMKRETTKRREKGQRSRDVVDRALGLGFGENHGQENEKVLPSLPLFGRRQWLGLVKSDLVSGFKFWMGAKT